MSGDTLDNLPGFYGKVPVLGDFVSRRLTPEFIRAWDKWLGGCLLKSREQLGDEWLNHYLTSPIWRFALSPGLCGKQGWLGVMIPSVDRVGRYFPLTLACPTGTEPVISWSIIDGDGWMDTLENLVLTALGDKFLLDDFDHNLRNHPWPGPAEAITEHRSDKHNQSSQNSTGYLNSGDTCIIRCSGDYIEYPGIANSLWLTAGSTEIPAHGYCWQGLPPAEIFGAMLGEATSIDSQLGNGWNRFVRNPMKDRATLAGSEAHMSWECAARSEVGRRRSVNEDACLMRPAEGLWAVADGMGGHEAGDFASQEVIRWLEKVPATNSLKAMHQQVQHVLLNANMTLREFAIGKGLDVVVGSTIVVFLARGNEGCVIWAGDSRLYRLRAGELQQLTEDHAWHDPSFNSAAESASPTSSRSNVITRAVGAYPQLKLDSEWLDIAAMDSYLLCSDGLDKELSAADIRRIMRRATQPQACVDDLMTLAIERGARDNVTAVVISPHPHGTPAASKNSIFD